MNDPSDLSVGSPEDRAHRAEVELDLIDEMGGEFLRHEDFNQGIRAAARVVLARMRASLEGEFEVDFWQREQAFRDWLDEFEREHLR